MLRASGYLPLTNESKLKLRLVTIGFIGLIPAGLALLAAAITLISSDPAKASSAGPLVVVALVALTVGVLGILYLAPRVGPTAIVMPPPSGYFDNLVELRRVHPAFVFVVMEQQAARVRAHKPQQWK